MPPQDIVQIEILTLSATTLGGLLLWTIWPTVQAVAQAARRLGGRLSKPVWLAIDVVLAAAFITTLITVTLLIREWLFTGKLSPEIAFGTLLAVLALALVAAVVGNFDPKPKGASRKFRVPAWVTVSIAIVAVGFVLAPEVPWVRDVCRKVFGWLNLLDNAAGQDAATRKIWDDANTVVQLILAALTAGSAAATSAGIVVDRLIDHRDDLTKRQKSVAKKFRHSADSAIINSIVDEYPSEVRIDILNPTVPFQLVGERKVRIKFVMTQGIVAPRNFSFTKLMELVETARIEPLNAIFFVVTHSQPANKDTGIVCYGTGEELMLLTDRSRPGAIGGDLSDAFFAALNDNEADSVIRAIGEGRRRLLRKHPEKRPLLSWVTHKASDELFNVLQTMTDERHKELQLDRILLIAASPPFEKAIVGGQELVRFLYEAP